MKTKLVRIGNSRGIRLPKRLIEQLGLIDEVDLEVRDGAIVLKPSDGPRRGWAEAAAAAGRRCDDTLIDEPSPTDFDIEDWGW